MEGHVTECKDRYTQIQKEEERFAKVLHEAPDDELFLMLRYALYHHYVPHTTYDCDPYESVYAYISRWHRTKCIYDELSERGRNDLLRQIYPNSEELGSHVRSVKNLNHKIQAMVQKKDSLEIECLKYEMELYRSNGWDNKVDSLTRKMNKIITKEKRQSIEDVINQRLAKDSLIFQSLDKEGILTEKYFGTPLVEKGFHF